ncbi:MAG: DUF262 domain-containing protein [Armatimonadetes bacterium]|nr:DUF262 domain-containing protein [Armatimonadota bacterium]
MGEGLQIRSKYGGFVIPPYQRQQVWSFEQQVRFMESLATGMPVGVYCVHQDLEHDVTVELLDGLQRWTAIFAFFDNKVPVFGLYHDDLTVGERRQIEYMPFPAYWAERFSEEEKRELFDRLAYGGTPNDPDGPRAEGVLERLK